MTARETWRPRALRRVHRILERAGLPRERIGDSVKLSTKDKYLGTPGRYLWLGPNMKAAMGFAPKLTEEQTELAAAALASEFSIVATFPRLAMVCICIPTPEDSTP